VWLLKSPIKSFIGGIDSPAKGDIIIKNMKLLRVGDVGKETGLSVKALRFCEKMGSIPAPERTLSSGYRLYTHGDVWHSG